MARKVIIIGGVAGGASAAARLRRLSERAEIVLLERGEFISFANCGLPYYVGGEIEEREALTLQTPDSFRTRFCVDVRVRQEAVRIDRAAKTVTVRNLSTGETYDESYDTLLLSPGAEPVKPNVPGVDSKNIYTDRSIPDALRIREMAEEGASRVVVVGGGYIGVEMAENLRRAGLAVTLVELSEQVIPPMDWDMACKLHRQVKKNGVNLLLKTGVRGFREEEDGLAVLTDKGEIPADFAVLAIGVRPESGLAADCGLATGTRGAIAVDDHMRTADPAIYAVGDAVEVTDFVTGERAHIPLAGPANRQGRIAADNIAGGDSAYTGTQGSAVLRVFGMTAALTGLSEKTAKRLGIPYEKSFTYSASHAGYYPGGSMMSIKTLFDPETGKLLGAQLVGFDGVDKRCDVFVTAIRAGMTARDLTELELCYAPPYSSAKDPVNMAGFVIENILDGQMKQFHWHDADELPRDGSVTLLDVRTAGEYQAGGIPGFVNIPLDELRGRLGELPAGKPVYVTCQIGLRGYLACRILVQNGFSAYNLSGGYRLYRSTHDQEIE